MQEPALVFYAPRQISAGEKVPLCHGGGLAIDALVGAGNVQDVKKEVG